MRVAFEIIIHLDSSGYEDGPTVGWKAMIDKVQYGKWCKIENRHLGEVVTAVTADFIATMQEPSKLKGLELFEGDKPIKPPEDKALNDMAERSFQAIEF